MTVRRKSFQVAQRRFASVRTLSQTLSPIRRARIVQACLLLGTLLWTTEPASVALGVLVFAGMELIERRFVEGGLG